MAIRGNSKEALDAIREHVHESVDDLYHSYTVRNPNGPNAFDAMQAMKEELSYEYARQGYANTFDYWVRGLNFGDLPDAEKHVNKWLQNTPEEAAKYSFSEAKNKYIYLVSKEFHNLAYREMPKEGWAIEFNPYCKHGNLNDIRGSVKLYRDGECVANVVDLETGQAKWLYETLTNSVFKTGNIPYALEHGCEMVHPDATNQIEAACHLACEKVLPYIRNEKHLMDKYCHGRIDEKTYYEQMDAWDARLKNDPSVPVEYQDLVDEQADTYWVESGAQKAVTEREKALSNKPRPEDAWLKLNDERSGHAFYLDPTGHYYVCDLDPQSVDHYEGYRIVRNPRILMDTPNCSEAREFADNRAGIVLDPAAHGPFPTILPYSYVEAYEQPQKKTQQQPFDIPGHLEVQDGVPKSMRSTSALDMPAKAVQSSIAAEGDSKVVAGSAGLKQESAQQHISTRR